MTREFGRGKALASRAAREKNRSHGSGLAEAVGRHVGLHKLHRVVDGETGRNRATRRVDVNVDVLRLIDSIGEQQLGHHGVGHVVVDCCADEDDSVFEQA